MTAAIMGFGILPPVGKHYDAAVISAGFIGMSLGATPTAVASMTAVTQRFGGSQKAFLIIPLTGAFFVVFKLSLYAGLG